MTCRYFHEFGRDSSRRSYLLPLTCPFTGTNREITDDHGQNVTGDDRRSSPGPRSGPSPSDRQPHTDAKGPIAAAEAVAARISTQEQPLSPPGRRLNGPSPFLIGSSILPIHTLGPPRADKLVPDRPLGAGRSNRRRCLPTPAKELQQGPAKQIPGHRRDRPGRQSAPRARGG